jgi:mannose-1-phosphate guanylyltransferase/mannose-6-phosphate isomerase
MIPVIMSGGSGTRLWPVSRAQWPKQFCEIFEESLMSLTIDRLKSLGPVRVLTSATLKTLTTRTLQQSGLPVETSLFEPMARNTAPAIAFLVKSLMDEKFDDEIVGIFPADHLVEDESAFQKAMAEAQRLAALGQIVTLGIQPTEPNTGYGYIQIQTKKLNEGSSVLQFHEKPNLATAEKFLQAGNYVWNGGIFVFKTSVMAKALAKHQPALWETLSTLKANHSNLTDVFGRLPSISIDYAVAEKLTPQELSCVPCEFGWSDVGSWDAVAEIFEKRKAKATEKVVEVKSANNFVFSEQKKVYSMVGVDDLIVVDTADALMISKRGETQDVKAVVESLSKQKDSCVISHTFEKRPWGDYEILRDTEDFKSKVIHVDPGQQLSLQSHAKREEHWVVTRGSGEVVLNDRVVPVKAGTYVHIPLGAKHRMRNTGKLELEFVEVQIGSYFGEDDIVRYQDDYQRA